MKSVALITILALASAGALQAGQAEQKRKSAENISINTASLHDNASTDQLDIQPVPVTDGLAELIAKLIKIIFGLDGDIYVATPPAEAPQVEGTLEDDGVEETYEEGASYDPVDESSLPKEPFNTTFYHPLQGFYQNQTPSQPQTPYQAQPPSQPQTPVYQSPSTARPDTGSQGGSVPADLKRKAMDYFNANQDRIQNKRYIGIVDFAAHSSRQRFWIIDLQTGAGHGIRVAHGAGSDPDGDGFATRFSNTPNSRASSLGFYLTGALYSGKHGRSMRLHGLSPTNSNALSRAVVLHDSDYVREANVRQGRSFGCLAVANSEIGSVLAALRGGALIYAGLSNSEF